MTPIAEGLPGAVAAAAEFDQAGLFGWGGFDDVAVGVAQHDRAFDDQGPTWFDRDRDGRRAHADRISPTTDSISPKPAAAARTA
jgi:hypothetical protein